MFYHHCCKYSPQQKKIKPSFLHRLVVGVLLSAAAIHRYGSCRLACFPFRTSFRQTRLETTLWKTESSTRAPQDIDRHSRSLPAPKRQILRFVAGKRSRLLAFFASPTFLVSRDENNNKDSLDPGKKGVPSLEPPKKLLLILATLGKDARGDARTPRRRRRTGVVQQQ